MTTINYIYLLQEREFLKTNENIYKIGKTKQENLKRLCNYPNGTQLIFQIICNNCDIIEKQLINTFREKYLLQKDIGNEYFKGNYKDMIDDIYNHIKIEESLPNINGLYNNIKGNFKELEMNNLYGQYVFLSINPNPLITLKVFINTITKMMTKPWIENYLYVYEQNGENEEECGKNFYFKTIIEKPASKSYNHILRELSSTANKVCDSNSPSFFNISRISKKDCQISVVDLTGIKAYEENNQKHAINIIWRQQNNLKEYYNVGII